MYDFVEVSEHNIESSQNLRLPYTMFTLQTSFKTLLLKGGGGGVKSVSIEVTVNSKEENS
jgi:hypothetical protein